jgi:hypothetical protein
MPDELPITKAIKQKKREEGKALKEKKSKREKGTSRLL